MAFPEHGPKGRSAPGADVEGLRQASPTGTSLSTAPAELGGEKTDTSQSEVKRII